jgi:hypothetical protein
MEQQVSEIDKPKVVYRADGVTEAERYLKQLCDHTFLSLWSYSGIFRDQGNEQIGEGKEVCDLLVVFENHIIIFSDKDCAFPNSGNTNLDWCRWFRRAVQNSAKQIWGAERWIRTHPDRMFLDRACTQKFPIDLPNLSTTKFHRILVAHDSSERCKREIGGSGSLIINPNIIADMHYDATKSTFRPFNIDQIDPAKGFVHVLDDSSLDIVLRTLDTISDFVEYLTKKEEFTLRGRLGYAASEEDLLAYYLVRVNEREEHDFIVPPNQAKLVVEAGHWNKFARNSQRLAQLRANEISYAWDALIESFSKHIIGGTQYFASPEGVNNGEKSIHFLARESRTRRRMLASALLEIIGKKVPDGTRYTRIVMPSHPGDPYYVFLLLPQPKRVSYEKYREVRRGFLEACCRVLKLRYPNAEDIMGIAMAPGISEESSEDAVYFDARHWTKEDQEDALELQRNLDLFQDLRGFATRVQEYPDVSAELDMVRAQPIKQQIKGRERNLPCPCGSGKKYKKCCAK